MSVMTINKEGNESLSIVLDAVTQIRITLPPHFVVLHLDCGTQVKVFEGELDECKRFRYKVLRLMDEHAINIEDVKKLEFSTTLRVDVDTLRQELDREGAKYDAHKVSKQLFDLQKDHNKTRASRDRWKEMHGELLAEYNNFREQVRDLLNKPLKDLDEYLNFEVEGESGDNSESQVSESQLAGSQSE